MIALARLLAKAAGAIGQGDGGDVQPFNGMGMPHVCAGEQGAFFFQGKLFDQIRVAHRTSLCMCLRFVAKGEGVLLQRG